MKVLQTIAGLGMMSGGTSTCTYDLLSAMHRAGWGPDLLTTLPRGQGDRLMGHGEQWIKALPNDCRTPYGYSAGMSRWLKASDYDIYHTNGLWMHINHATAATARRKGRPSVVTPHGMLYPDALRRSYWKKWPLMKLWFNRDITSADCIHATCRQEMDNIRLFGYRGPVAVIPNPVAMPECVTTVANDRETAFMGCKRPKSLGFLGRLHPRKKVENLLYGMCLLDPTVAADAQLVIMGKGDEAYEQFLRSETMRLGLTDCVTFAGFVSGEEKYRRLASLACLMVPSDFENFGMIVTEALAVGTPVMASLGTPWEELNSERCGWWVDATPENVAAAMTQALTMPADELIDMGRRGRQLVAAKYSDTQVAAAMTALYRWLLGAEPRPAFVHLP